MREYRGILRGVSHALREAATGGQSLGKPTTALQVSASEEGTAERERAAWMPADRA